MTFFASASVLPCHPTGATPDPRQIGHVCVFMTYRIIQQVWTSKREVTMMWEMTKEPPRCSSTISTADRLGSGRRHG